MSRKEKHIISEAKLNDELIEQHFRQHVPQSVSQISIRNILQYTFKEFKVVKISSIDCDSFYNFVTPAKKIAFDEWFTYISYMPTHSEKKSFCRVKLLKENNNDENNYNLVNNSYEYVLSMPVKSISQFDSNNISNISLNNRWNLLNTDGRILSENWFFDIVVHDFNDIPYYQVYKEEESVYGSTTLTNILDKNGKLLFDTWLDEIRCYLDWRSGNIFQIRKHGLVNVADINGNILSKLWFDDILNELVGGKLGVILNQKVNLLNSNGSLLLKKWYSYIRYYTTDREFWDQKWVYNLYGTDDTIVNVSSKNGELFFNTDVEGRFEINWGPYIDGYVSAYDNENEKMVVVDGYGNEAKDFVFDEEKYNDIDEAYKDFLRTKQQKLDEQKLLLNEAISEREIIDDFIAKENFTHEDIELVSTHMVNNFKIVRIVAKSRYRIYFNIIKGKNIVLDRWFSSYRNFKNYKDLLVIFYLDTRKNILIDDNCNFLFDDRGFDEFNPVGTKVVYEMYGDLFVVKVHGKKNVLNLKKRVLVFNEWLDDIVFNVNYGFIVDGNQIKLIDKECNFILDYWIDSIRNVSSLGNNFLAISKNGKCNFLSKETYTINSEMWFDGYRPEVYGNYRDTELIRLELYCRVNILGKDGKPLLKKWYNSIRYIANSGEFDENFGYCFYLKNHDTENFADLDGNTFFINDLNLGDKKWHKFGVNSIFINIVDKDWAAFYNNRGSYQFVNRYGEIYNKEYGGGSDNIEKLFEKFKKDISSENNQINESKNTLLESKVNEEKVKERFLNYYHRFVEEQTPTQLVFSYSNFGNGFKIAHAKGTDSDYCNFKYYNFIRPNGDIVFDFWVDRIVEHRETDNPDEPFIISRYDRDVLGENLIDINCNLLLPAWVDGILFFKKKNQCAVIKNKDKWNIIDIHGNILLDEWYDDIKLCASLNHIQERTDDFNYKIKNNGKCTVLYENLKPKYDKWFDGIDCCFYVNRENMIFDKVILNGRANIADENGRIISKTWVDDFYTDNMGNNRLLVELKNKFNVLDLTTGEFMFEIWGDDITYFNNPRLKTNRFYDRNITYTIYHNTINGLVTFNSAYYDGTLWLKNPKFLLISCPFTDGHAVAILKDTGEVYVIDRDGNIVPIPFEFNNSESYQLQYTNYLNDIANSKENQEDNQ